MKRPIIGVACMNSHDTHGRSLMAVRPAYLRALEAAGGVPLCIHLTDDLEVVQALYQQCDGILLPGGDDVDPNYYHEAPHPALGDVDVQRDSVELALARWTLGDQKPLMGICRGIQMINVAFGGTLYQDIPSQLPAAMDHRANIACDQYDVLTHTIALVNDSWLATCLSTTTLMGNTMHHQAVKDVAPGLRVVGYAPDGVIEAIEGTGKQFVVAVQCHPEYLWARAEPRWLHLFTGFIQSCRK